MLTAMNAVSAVANAAPGAASGIASSGAARRACSRLVEQVRLPLRRSPI